MEEEREEIMEEVLKLQRIKNDQFYDQHVNEHYNWDNYVDFKEKNTTKTQKLVNHKEKNLKDQRKSVALVGYRMRDHELNIAKANVKNVHAETIVVNPSKRLSVKNPLAAIEQIIGQQGVQDGIQ